MVVPPYLVWVPAFSFCDEKQTLLLCNDASPSVLIQSLIQTLFKAD